MEKLLIATFCSARVLKSLTYVSDYQLNGIVLILILAFMVCSYLRSRKNATRPLQGFGKDL